MKKAIHRLKEQPHAARKRFAFWTALTLTVIIAFVWFGVSTLLEKDDVTTVAENPISLVIDTFSELIPD
tara:strand:+ start:203 stop:409 length:207 start_codon:yes stop_codon:yes gene_type:complete